MALDQATGATLWRSPAIAGAANAAYEDGTVFVASCSDYVPILQAFDAATGSRTWTTPALSTDYDHLSAPTALGGKVFAGLGHYGGGKLLAVSEADGSTAWTQNLLGDADSCAPAVGPDGVYTICPMVAYAFDPAAGTGLWYAQTGSDYVWDAGATPVLVNGTLFAPDGIGTYAGQTLDAGTGTAIGTYAADVPPAIGADTGYFLQNETLRGISLDGGGLLWSFTGDGTLATSPIMVNQYVFIGSADGHLYGLDAATGSQVWVQDLGAEIPTGAFWGTPMPLSGLSAGDGLLVVPAGNTLTAYRLAAYP